MLHRRDIEGLRAVAVLAVIAYHFHFGGVGGGFVGVDVFFVVSGFLITSLLLREHAESGRISFARFYARRVKRLLPISAVVLAATAVASMLWLDPTRLDTLRTDTIAASLFGANTVFGWRGTDYLASNLPPSPLQHYWSLSVEEQFYAIWPALIALTAVLPLGSRSVRRRALTAVALLSGASFVASVALSASQASWSYFGLHTRAWEMGAGALLACAWPEVARIQRGVRAVLGWTGIGLVAFAVAGFGSVSGFPGWLALVPVLGAVLVLGAGDDTDRGPVAVLRTGPLQWIGARSYSFYLWHWPVIIVAEGRNEGPLTLVQRTALLAGVVAVSELGFRAVERPARSSRTLSTRHGVAIGLGGLLVAGGIGSGFVVGAYDPDLSTGVVVAAPDLDPVTTTTVADPPPINNDGAAPLAAIRAALTTRVLPDNLVPDPDVARNDVALTYDNGCHGSYRTRPDPDCVFGDPTGDVTVALWGDSHAAQWFDALADIGARRGWRVLSITTGGCPIIEVLTYNKVNQDTYEHCFDWRRRTRAYLREQRVDVVFLASYYRSTLDSTRKPIRVADWERRLPELLDGLQDDGIEPVVIGGIPDPPRSVPGCVTMNRRDIMECAARADDEFYVGVDSAVGRIAREHGAGFFAPMRWMCAAGLCPPVVGNILVYRDSYHLTTTFAKWMTPVIEATVAARVEWVAARNG